MHHNRAKLTIEQRIIIGFFRGIKWTFVSLFSLLRGGKLIFSQKVSNRPIKQLSKEKLNEMGNKWREIEDLINLGGISQMKQALLEADKLVDHLLQKKQVKGSTFGERLKSAEELFSPTVYNNLWEAHKLRNTLAHEINHEIFHWQIKDAISHFKSALKELGAI